MSDPIVNPSISYKNDNVVRHTELSKFNLNICTYRRSNNTASSNDITNIEATTQNSSDKSHTYFSTFLYQAEHSADFFSAVFLRCPMTLEYVLGINTDTDTGILCINNNSICVFIHPIFLFYSFLSFVSSSFSSFVSSSLAFSF